MIVALLGFLVCSLVSADTLFEGSVDVADLTEASQLHDRLPPGQSCPALIIFYDSTCGHCRTVAPRLANMSAALSLDASTNWLLVGAVDCAQTLGECTLRNVTDVPTLFYAASRSDWRVLPQSVDEVEDAIRKQLAAQGSAMSEHEKDLCRSARVMWRSEKHRKEPQDHTTNFSEERAFHATDVAASLFYTLYHEVPMVSLSVDKRRVVERFLRVVSGALPGLGTDALLTSLMALHQNPLVSPAEWRAAVEAAHIPFRGTLDRPEWLTCRGSSWKYRGFACGMWLMYHALTANSGEHAYDALTAIRAYALSFFACSDCRQHFSKFSWSTAERHRLSWSPLLQLWAAHNQVNRRLASVRDGADPLVPKRQFPDAALCATCHRRSVAATAPTDDNQTTNEEFLASQFDVGQVSLFLTAWYKWEAPVPPCPEEGDTCPLPSPRTSPAPQALEGVWFRKTRHPDFVQRRDSALVHSTLTVFVVVGAVAAGYFVTSTRSPGKAFLRRRAHTSV